MKESIKTVSQHCHWMVDIKGQCNDTYDNLNPKEQQQLIYLNKLLYY